MEVREFWPTEEEPEEPEHNNSDYHDSDSDYSGISDAGDYIGLQLGGLFSSFMEINFGCRTTWDEPLEDCPPPSALQICHESRAHTLKHFIYMKDSRMNLGSFYFNPR
jgi:hypothetical protein